jgi:hypothetical protein
VRTTLRALPVLLASAAAFAAEGQRPRPQPTRVGEEVYRGYRNPAVVAVAAAGPRLVWSQRLTHPGADYIAPHFAQLDLPPGASLVLRSPSGLRSIRYQDQGKAGLGTSAEGFWGLHIPGPEAVLELWSDGVEIPEGAVQIDRFARGFNAKEFFNPESICGTDDSNWAKCYQTSEPTLYGESRAVARLLINGTGGCTGWLVGSGGHLMTNEHCIGNASSAANTDFELMAEGSTCTTNCASRLACPGTVVADTSTLVKLNAALDYTLVQLPTNPTGTYGYLQLRSSGAVVNERIYIPGHPALWGKRISVLSSEGSDQSGFAEIFSLNEAPCAGGPGDVGYFGDTQGGSSGSPVVAYGDHLVVALHHCGGCPNTGVPIQAIISDLGTQLPPNAVGGGGGGGTTVFFDDFETDRGWTRNPNGTDTATTGLWERGDPQATNSSGPKQLGTTVSGVNDLVTGRLAGTSAGTHDIDGGLTSIQSPAITLPSSGTITLSFSYYMAHGSNSSSADLLRLSVVNSSGGRTQVFLETGAANDDDAAWAQASASIGSFAGQTIRILIEAADASGASLVEAAIDDLRITRTP